MWHSLFLWETSDNLSLLVVSRLQCDDHHVDAVAARQSRSSQLRFICSKCFQTNFDAVHLPPVEQSFNRPVSTETHRGGWGGSDHMVTACEEKLVYTAWHRSVILDLLSWYVVQNWALGFFLRRKATVTMTSSKSETGYTCLLSLRFTQHGLKYVDTSLKSQIWIRIQEGVHILLAVYCLHFHVILQEQTLRLVENIWSQDDVQFRKQNEVRWDFPPGETQHVHITEAVGLTAAPAVLQTQRIPRAVGQDHLRTAPGSHHTWQTHTCTELQRHNREEWTQSSDRTHLSRSSTCFFFTSSTVSSLSCSLWVQRYWARTTALGHTYIPYCGSRTWGCGSQCY